MRPPLALPEDLLYGLHEIDTWRWTITGKGQWRHQADYASLNTCGRRTVGSLFLNCLRIIGKLQPKPPLLIPMSEDSCP